MGSGQSGGRTLTDLAEELNGRGILTRSGKRWTRVNLHRRLQSAAFLGEAVFRRPDQQWGGHCTRLGSDGRPLHGATAVIPLPPILSADRIRLPAHGTNPWALRASQRWMFPQQRRSTDVSLFRMGHSGPLRLCLPAR
ncbi:recombinase family protein [Streptomyces sp. KM273126]|uniref:recombinase family protein n=1 Tax=Streptomyces sp. KM273126 TaxID=2545247 RepID=UPI001038C5F4|nr:recombinase family protein [Streptomyces sp. KM273126]